MRYDKASGEELGIQPQERKDENSYMWNFVASLVISNHDNKRLYFAAHKVFRTDDQGNSWQVISEDLTGQIDRNKLKVMDKVWGIDAIAKNGSTSQYGTIVAMDESAINENLLYVGTDDGLIQITENGGESWTKVASFPGVPNQTYVNMVLASQHDENVVYACFNRHKYGNFKPYVYKSADKGRTWKAITNNLPERGSSYAIAEDFEDPNLLFVGTEFGVFTSNNGGMNWKQIKSGVPTIAVRDLAIHKRETDLVLGTFGRGFLVLDDYSSLRDMSDATLSSEAKLFSVRDTWLYEQSFPLGLPGKSFQGDNYFQGDNLAPSAIFTYYLKDEIKSLKDERRENEKDQTDNNYPSYDALKAERMESAPQLIFTVTNGEGKVVRKLFTKPKKGVNRIQWDLRYTDTDPINLTKPSFYNPWSDSDKGILVKPGDYTVAMASLVRGEYKELSEPVTFRVKALQNATLPAMDRDALDEFNRKVLNLSGVVGATRQTIREIENQLKHIDETLRRAEVAHNSLTVTQINDIRTALDELKTNLNGDRVARTLDIDKPPTVGQRVGYLTYSLFASTSPPTKTNMDSYAIAEAEFPAILERVRKVATEDLVKLQNALNEVGAPYTPYSIPRIPTFEP